MCQTKGLSICWDRHEFVFLEALDSKMWKTICNISSFICTSKQKQPASPGSAPSYRGAQYSAVNFSKFYSDAPPPTPRQQEPCRPILPFATNNLLDKHPEPITINPTPGNTPWPQAHTKTSLSITGESYCPTNRSFLPQKSFEPLNHYVLEVGLFVLSTEGATLK